MPKKIIHADEWQDKLKHHKLPAAPSRPAPEQNAATVAHGKLQDMLKLVFNGALNDVVRGYGIGLDHEERRRDETVLKVNFRTEAALSKAMKQLPPVIDNFRVKLYAEKAPARSL